MYTLDEIKNDYFNKLMYGDTEFRGLEEYIQETYVRVYDKDLNFIGYEKQ